MPRPTLRAALDFLDLDDIIEYPAAAPVEMGYSEIAPYLGVTPQRVQQIEKAALAKVRAAIEAGDFPAGAEERDVILAILAVPRFRRPPPSPRSEAKRQRDRERIRVRKKPAP